MEYLWNEIPIMAVSFFEEDGIEKLKEYNVKYEIIDEFMAIEIGLITSVYGADVRHVKFISPLDGKHKQAIILTIKHIDSWDDIYFKVESPDRLSRNDIKEIIFKYFDILHGKEK